MQKNSNLKNMFGMGLLIYKIGKDKQTSVAKK